MKVTPIKGRTETEGSIHIYRGNKLIVARSGNTNFKKVFRELLKPFKEEFDSGRMSEEQSNEIMIDCVAKTILVGWTNLKDVDGVEHKYSYDNAKALLTDDKDAYDSIMIFAENIDNYLTVADEALEAK